MSEDEKIKEDIEYGAFTARNFDILESRINGATCKDIAEYHNISPSRVLKIVKNMFTRLKNSSEIYAKIQYNDYYKKNHPEPKFKFVFPKRMSSITISDMEISVRLQNCFKKHGITTLKDLCLKSETDLMRTENFGRKSLNEVREIVEYFDLSLGMVDLKDIKK